MNREDYFIKQEFIAMALLEHKNNLFNENFFTLPEFNVYKYYMQQVFNDKKLNTYIEKGYFNWDCFERVGDSIVPNGKGRFRYELKYVDGEVYSVLMDQNLAIDFFVKMKTVELNDLQERINRLKRKATEDLELKRKYKVY